MWRHRALGYFTQHGLGLFSKMTGISKPQQLHIPRYHKQQNVPKVESITGVRYSTTHARPVIDRMIEVRRAMPEDYEAVMDIKNVIQEMDYLPSLYHQLISDPDSAYYVCLVDGETAGFAGISLLDDNKTIMQRSFRIKNKFSGQGIPLLLRKKLYEDFKSMPGRKRIRTGVAGNSHYARSKTFRSENKTLKIEESICFLDVDVRRKTPECVNDNDNEAKSIAWEDFRHLLLTRAVKNHLYPDHLMSASFWFYDVIPSNIRHMKKCVDRIFVTKDLLKFLPSDQTKKENPLQCEEGHCDVNCVTQGMVAIVVPYFSPTHLCCFVNTAGIPTYKKEVENIAGLLKPCLSRMQALCSGDNKPQMANIFFVGNEHIISEDLFYEAVRPLGLKYSKQNLKRRQYYFEQEFHNFHI